MANEEKDKAGLLTDRQEQLLGAFVDGELDGEDLTKVESRLEAGDVEMSREVESIRGFRKTFRQCFESQLVDCSGGSHEVDMWDRIKDELGSKKRARAWFQGFTESLKGVLSDGSEIFSAVQPRVVLASGFVLVALLSLAVFGDYGRGSADLEQFTRRLPGTDGGPGKLEPIAGSMKLARSGVPGGEASIDLPELALDAEQALLGEREMVLIPDELAKQERREILRPWLRDLRGQGVLPGVVVRSAGVSEPVVAGGAELPGNGIGTVFDWIKSDRAFHIVPVAENGTPPVIWVASRSRPMD